MRLAHRALGVGAALLVLAPNMSRSPTGGRGGPPEATVGGQLLDEVIDGHDVAVLLPPGYDPDDASPYPLVVVFHGMAESRGSERQGARAWFDVYHLPAAQHALAGGALGTDDFGGLVTTDQLAGYNQALQASPYQGVVVAGVYTPGTYSGPALEAFDAFVAGDLVQTLRARFDVARDPAQCVVEGVSLGGHHALYVGLRHPDVFGLIGALQPAVTNDMEGLVAAAKRPRGAQRIHLVTSDGDAFLGPTIDYARLLSDAGVPNTDLVVLRGPHGYSFNQGPGAIELLFFADRAARGIAGLR
jgi:pimeloyl-ACP methyl ester carboxylesterase